MDDPLAASRARVGARILRLALFFGLLAAIAEGVVRVAQRLVPDHDGWAGDLLPEILWILPAVYVPLFLCIGLVLAALALLLPRRVRADAVASALLAALVVYAAVLAMLQFYEWELYWWSIALLGAGVAAVVYRGVARRPPSAELASRRGFIGAVGSLVLLNLVGRVLGPASQGPAGRRVLGAGVGLSDALAVVGTRRGLAAALVTGQPELPNVLLVVLDTLRADRLGALGSPRPTTPNLDRIAGEGVLFEHAFATGSWTLPSHASLFTGRYVYEHQAISSPLGTELPTLAEFLSSHGYTTAGFTANNRPARAASGFGRGFQVYDDYYANVADMAYRTAYGTLFSTALPGLGYWDIPGRKDAASVNRDFLSWLDAQSGARFFTFLNYFDAHDPYLPPPPYDRLFTDTPTRGDRLNSHVFLSTLSADRELTPQEIATEIAAYDGAVAYVDSQVGALFAALQERGILDRTLVILTADHGEQFGEHRLFGHVDSLYGDVVRVPLIVRYAAGAPRGVRVRPAVSLQAVPATVASMVGLTEGSPFPGPSLARHWAAESGSGADDLAVAEHLTGSARWVKSVSTAEWHWMVNRQGRSLLFNTVRDPREERDEALSQEGQRVIQDLQARAAEFVTRRKYRVSATSWESFD